VKLSLATITRLDENEDEKWVHVIHLQYKLRLKSLKHSTQHVVTWKTPSTIPLYESVSMDRDHQIKQYKGTSIDDEQQYKICT
jgi:hypothetical protein